MNNHCGWIALAGELPARPTLGGTQRADWLIIGGGITGLSAAHSLAARFPQQRVLLLERQRIAQGASARNSGFVVAHELPAASERLGQPGHAAYQVASRIGIAAAREVRERIAALDIDCELFEDGYHFAAHRPEHLGDVDGILATLASVGANASYYEGTALERRLGSAFYARAIHCADGNALLQPGCYVKGLAENLPASVQVFEQSGVTDLRRSGQGWVARTAQGEVHAPQVLVCLGAFIARAGLHDSGAFPLELSASITRPLDEPRWQSLFGERQWGVLAPLAGGGTVRLLPGRRLLIRNTVEYRHRDLDNNALAERRRRHLAGLQKRFPGIVEADIAYTWTGHLSGTRSGEPYFARVDQGLHAVAGCNGSGVARGTLWGRLLAEMAAGDSSPVLADVLAQASPGYLPPSPFFDIGASLRIAWEVRRARAEA
ncbi:NAD(P)/FAD-dependent oxidoreductase [Pseudomonas sp. Pseusp97]|uniref:NAD(P)/FAD-dependent oxidoreductase n=1 Tax=Pseudomonas sp. Pseusp97 TaxID=3243065 RepID=UPI0039A65E43